MRVQKGKPRFSKTELWNFDTALSEIIAEGLKQFKTVKKHTIPPHLYINIDGEPINKNWDFSTEYCNEAWDNLLDSMIYGFDKIKEYEGVSFSDMTYNSLSNPELFGVKESDFVGGIHVYETKLKDGYTQEQYDKAVEDYKTYYKKVREERDIGRKLFAAYLDYLWD